MAAFLADDFSEIAKRMSALKCNDPQDEPIWFCASCDNFVVEECVAQRDPEAARCPDCDCVIHLDCKDCGNGGYVETTEASVRATFVVCESCLNPFNHPYP